MVSRIGSLSLFTNTFRNLSNVQADLANLQRQISSGVKANNFRDMNGQVEQFTFLEASLRQTTRFLENNQINEARLRTADQALSQVTDIMDNVENIFVQRRNGALINDVNFDQQVRNLTQSIANELNVNFEGRSLFGGTNTGTPPVPDPFVAPIDPDVPDAGYYAGSERNVVYRTDNRTEFDFPVRADDVAFQKFFAAVNKGLKAHAEGNEVDLSDALDLLQSAQGDLNAARARTNSSIIVLSQINERHTSTSLYLRGVTEEIGRTDVVSASIEIANNQAILQAGFQAFSRISQLRLSDFLR
jgi:flagellin-like hook-associated protein FlgL